MQQKNVNPDPPEQIVRMLLDKGTGLFESGQSLTGWSGHADAEARRSVLTALPCATLVTVGGGATLPAAGNTPPLPAAQG